MLMKVETALDKAARAQASLLAALLAGHPLVAGWSAGKDSSVLVLVLLLASLQAKSQGCTTPIVITHSDTRVENPEMVQLARSEMAKMQSFVDGHGLPVQVIVGQPEISQSWAVRVIGGRALPPFPDTRRDCTTDWKIAVNERNMAAALASLAQLGLKEPVVCTGVRFGESQERDQAIRARGERDDQIWLSEEGKARLSPLLRMNTDDIWELLGLANAGQIESYSDFSETMRVYRDGGGSSCVVVSDMAMAKFAKPCSSRFGCWTCTAVAKDRSLGHMIESDPVRYGYMEPLADLRNFIADTQYDWSRRNWVQRTINDGHIRIGPDAYSPQMLADLLRYALTAQMDSGVEIITPAMLVAIDARWSLYALHPPFEALRIWLSIDRDGERFYPPKVERFPKTPVPDYGEIEVGRDWDDGKSPLYAEGLRHPVWEMFSDSCGPSLRVFGNGKVGIEVEEGIEVDEESAEDFLQFFAEEKAEEPIRPNTPWTSGALYYLSLGTVTPARGQSQRWDEFIRRSHWRQELGLHGQQDPEVLYERCSRKRPKQVALF